MMRLIGCFLRDDRGVTSVEYALIAVGISIAIVGAIVAVEASVKAKYTSVSDAFVVD